MSKHAKLKNEYVKATWKSWQREANYMSKHTKPQNRHVKNCEICKKQE